MFVRLMSTSVYEILVRPRVCFSHSGVFWCVFGVDCDAGAFGSEVTDTPAFQISLDFYFLFLPPRPENVCEREGVCVCTYPLRRMAPLFSSVLGVSLGLAAGRVSQCYQTQRGASLHMNNN